MDVRTRRLLEALLMPTLALHRARDLTARGGDPARAVTIIAQAPEMATLLVNGIDAPTVHGTPVDADAPETGPEIVTADPRAAIEAEVASGRGRVAPEAPMPSQAR